MKKQLNIFKAESDNVDIINSLSIKNITEDPKLLIYNLGINEEDFYIETGLLKVISINKNKIQIKLDDNTLKVFNQIDLVCKDLLENFLNNNNTNLTNFNLIDFISNTSDENIYKLVINSQTNIKLGNKKININDIKIDDSISFIIKIDYISLIIESSEARTKFLTNSVKINRNKKNTITKSNNNSTINTKINIITDNLSSNKSDNLSSNKSDIDVQTIEIKQPVKKQVAKKQVTKKQPVKKQINKK
jgi:hypothetical protein